VVGEGLQTLEVVNQLLNNMMIGLDVLIAGENLMRQQPKDIYLIAKTRLKISMQESDRLKESVGEDIKDDKKLTRI